MSISIRKNGKPFDAFVPTISIRKSLRAVQRALRAIYSFDGVDDRGQLAFRAINPDGDIDVEWRQTANTGKHVINQNISSTNSLREFTTYIEPTTGRLLMIVGGVGYGPVTATYDYRQACKVRVTLTGTIARFFADDVLTHQQDLARGTARESNAQTMVGCRANNSVGVYSDYFTGRIFDVKINGILWPMSEKGQLIQLPVPSGLGLELLKNPNLLDATTTNLPDWSRTAQTTLGYADSSLVLTNASTNPAAIWQSFSTVAGQQYLLEFTTLSGTAQLRVTVHAGSSASYNGSIENINVSPPATARRIFFTASSNQTVIGFYCNTGNVGAFVSVASISVKPMYATSPTQLVTNGDFSVDADGWSVQNGGAISVSNGQATLTTTAGQPSRFERGISLVAGKFYEASMDVISLAGAAARISVIRGVAGNYASVATTQGSTALGRTSLIFLAPASDALIQVVSNNPTVGTVVVDNVSVREITSLCNPLTLSNTNLDRWGDIEGSVPKSRWVYDFDGVDDRGLLATRAINVDGDNTFEFWTPTQVSASDQQIIAQNVTSGGAGSEFRITYINNGTSVHSLGITYGGVGMTIATNVQGLKAGTRYGLSLIGTTATLYEGGLTGTLVRSVQFVRGTVREPSANTMVMTRGAGSTTSYVQYAGGQQCDIKINGILLPMSDRNQPIQLPSPSGLGAELITRSVLENPAVKGPTWTYLGAGRWQYIGDGTGSDLAFIAANALPETGFIEYEVESYEFISGPDNEMRISSTTANFMGDRKFRAPGLKRAYYTEKPANISFVRNGGASLINCIIKNISFKPLWTANALELSSNRPAGEFINTATAVIAGSALARLTTNDIPVEPNTRYQVLAVGGGADRSRWQYRRASDSQWQWGGENLNYSTGDSAITPTLLTPNDCNAVRIYFKSESGSATGLSIRKIETLCNFLTLTNTTPDRWKEVLE